MRVNVNPLEHARRIQLGRALLKEEPRWLTEADLLAWKPDKNNRRKPNEQAGDEWRFRHEFLPHNKPFILAYFRVCFRLMANGTKHAASISIMDMARAEGVPIRDKDGNLVTGDGIAVSNNWEPMLARLLGNLHPEFPVGYSYEFAKDETPFMTLVKPSKGPFSDWLEGWSSPTSRRHSSGPKPPPPPPPKPKTPKPKTSKPRPHNPNALFPDWPE
jgi:hypothetical protein